LKKSSSLLSDAHSSSKLSKAGTASPSKPVHTKHAEKNAKVTKLSESEFPMSRPRSFSSNYSPADFPQSTGGGVFAESSSAGGGSGGTAQTKAMVCPASSSSGGSPRPSLPLSSSLGSIPSPTECINGFTFNKADVVQALMFMVCSNISQLAFLNARHYNITRVFFSGGFVRNNPLLWHKLSESIDYWSKGEMKAHFLLHDGYLGALGALLAGVENPSKLSTPNPK
jgi:hypothetical protein